MFLSKMRIYSVGVVAENKPLSEDVVQIVPVEVLPMLDGELKANPQALEENGVDGSGNSYSVSVDTDIVISAKWLRWNTNRQTSPDVRRGERVLLWQYADTDKFYWTSLGMDNHLRKLETVRYVISATQDEEDTVLTPENTYSFELSSHGKYINIHTSKANGEPFEYTIQINTDVGAITITDDVGNYLELDSQENKITSKNVDGTEWVLDKKVLRGYAKDFCEIHIDGPCHVIAPQIHLGEKDALQPSVLGDNLAKALTSLIQQINSSRVIGNLGAPTSPIMAVREVVEKDLELKGNSYSTVNKNQ